LRENASSPRLDVPLRTSPNFRSHPAHLSMQFALMVMASIPYAPSLAISRRCKRLMRHGFRARFC